MDTNDQSLHMEKQLDDASNLKVIIVEKPSIMKHFEILIGQVVSRYKFHTAGTTGSIITLFGRQENGRDLFNGRYNTIKHLLTDGYEIIVATDYSSDGDMLFLLTRDLVEVNKPFTRMRVLQLDEDSILNACNARKPEGSYQMTLSN